MSVELALIMIRALIPMALAGLLLFTGYLLNDYAFKPWHKTKLKKFLDFWRGR